MHSSKIRVFEPQDVTMPPRRRKSGQKLRALAAVMITLVAGMPPGFAQETAPAVTDKAASNLPPAPAPVLTQPLSLRQAEHDFAKPHGRFFGNPINMYRPITVAKANFANSVRLADMVKDGKIYLSLSDAIALAIENNYDIAIARYNLDIADTDILRTRAGSSVRGVNTGVVSNTLGGSSSALTSGGGPGGTTGGAGGAASGSSGLVLSTGGAGPMPENLDPVLTAAIKFDRARQVSTSFFSGGTSSNNTYDFAYTQGFVTGTNFEFDFNNTYATTTNGVTLYSPQLSANFKAQVTQHLLQGAGIWVNKRFMYEAVNDRRITDASFRQQILYTVNQVENIYWGLVSAYEDVQAKDRALQQSTKLLSDDQKQLQIGTMAPLDVVNAQSQVASDRQALISAQSTLNYQQQIIKQAIARNLNDPALESAPVIPTDRVSLDELPEERQPVEELVQEAFKQRPELEQAVLNLKNDEITLKGARNALLPSLDVYGYLGGSGVAGSINKNLNCAFYGGVCPTGSSGYGDALQSTYNNSSPDKGIGFNLSIPLSNRTAQADQARSVLEYRQAELRLEQLYTQIRMQVVNAKFALTNDRAQVRAAVAAQDYAQQSLDAEVKKLHLGASTTANVLQQERNLATADNNLISAKGAYAKDRAGLYQTLASTLQHYGINLQEAATGNMSANPVIPGLQPAEKGNEPSTTPPPAGH
ncbi:MAG TPA: TolC family protein [Terracidiphilus sp.]|nr:TolC family protein [Terracidiphilus sp.]